MKPFNYRPLTALLAFGAVSGIGPNLAGGGGAYAADTPDVGLVQQEIDLGDLAGQCGFACPGDEDADGNKVKTLAEGNVNISGIPSIDGFFASVVNFQVASKSVVAGINTQLEGIRADFELGAGDDVGKLLQAKLEANLDAGFSLKVEPAQCKVDLQAEFKAAARCDVKATPGMLSVDCKGGCDVDVKVPKCSAEAELRCTVQQPEIKCEGECTGKCSVDFKAAAACNGQCNGTCDGTCSAYVKDSMGKAQCAGSCSGMCTGSCDVDVSADAKCDGKCRGECTVTKAGDAGCEGGVRAQCRGKAGAAIKCDTKCDGEFTPPMVDARCQAKAHADAKLNVQCTPPRVALQYRLKASLMGEARLRFQNALDSLVTVRLPGLKAAVARSSIVQDAGKDILAAAANGGSFKDAVVAAKAKGSADLKFVFGITCAAEQVDDVADILKDSADKLAASLKVAGTVQSSLKI